MVVLGIAAYYWFVLADRHRHHEYQVQWPADAPRGDPVHVAYGVKAGDVFVTDLRFESGLVLGFAQGDPMGGMRLDGLMTVAQAVEPAEGGRLRSTVKVYLELCDATYAPMKQAVWDLFRDRAHPYTVTFDRDASGRPVLASVGGALARSERRVMLDTLTAGLGDLATSWLPPRDVRLGESWDVAECADVPGILPVVRKVAGTEGASGFPAGRVKGRVGAEAVEAKEGEECLRLRIAVYTTMEGEVVPPAREGWLTTAGRIQGQIWVSLATGVVWAMDVTADLTSSYLVKDKADERMAKQHVTTKTARATKMPQ